jgi:hypothetical protein
VKTLFTLIVVLVFCTHNAEGGGSPLFNGDVQNTEVKGGLLAQNTASSPAQKEGDPARPGGNTALTVHIDPETGKFIEPPEKKASPTERIEQPEGLSTSDEVFEEVASPVPGGGTKIDLKGRYNYPLSVTIEESGKIKMGHFSTDKKE